MRPLRPLLRLARGLGFRPPLTKTGMEAGLDHRHGSPIRFRSRGRASTRPDVRLTPSTCVINIAAAGSFG
jgi:hypothetical protein